MKVYVFRGAQGVFGFTQQQNGSNLPSDYAPWEKKSEIEMTAGEVGRIGVDSKQALADIAEHGFHLTKPKITITRLQGEEGA